MVTMVVGILVTTITSCSFQFVLCFFSGFLAEHMDLRHFLTVGMMSSGLLTIAFGLGYVWKIHYFAYFVTVQVHLIHMS